LTDPTFPDTGSAASSKTDTVKALFVHHSVGGQLLQAGRLRDLLAEQARRGGPTVQLWDHDYNRIGLSDADGRRLDRSFPVPDDNTDPSGLVKLAAADGGAAPYLAELLGFDVVLMKSCFPNSGIRSDQAFDALQGSYRQLFEAVAGWTTSAVLLTSPPLTPFHTDAEQAARAIRMARWLADVDKPANLHVFDLFGVLAEPSGRHAGMLRKAYRRRFRMPDSHPNDAGAQAGARALADYLAPRWAELVGGASRS
jgi:hypothetical protein